MFLQRTPELREIIKHVGVGDTLMGMEDHFLFARDVMYFFNSQGPVCRLGVVGAYVPGCER